MASTWETAVLKPNGRSKYVPPKDWRQISAKEAGLSNGAVLRFPNLWIAGDVTLLERPAVAIVGSRKATPEGCKRAAQLARELVKHGIVVMSGLAEGIDRAAHEAALEYGGRTIAVIGTPLDKAYPAKHSKLQEQIYRDHLLVSPFNIGEKTHPGSFPERNKVMARLSRATAIIEASDTSGTLHQAVECEKSGRTLYVAESVWRSHEWPKRFPSALHLEDPQQIIADISG